MRIKGIKIDEDVARILNEQDNDNTSIFETRGSGWSSLYDYVSKAFDRLAAGYSHPSQVPDFLQTRDLLEKLTKHELKLAKQEFFEEDLQAALDRWFEEADDYTNESINESESCNESQSQARFIFNLTNNEGTFEVEVDVYKDKDGDFYCNIPKHKKLGKDQRVVGNTITILRDIVKREFEKEGYNVKIKSIEYPNKNKSIKEGFNKGDNDFPEGSFAAWYGEDLSGQTYEGDLYCSHQNLTSLFGCPSVVIGDFDCPYNQLTSLEGAPKEVEGDFDCSHNQLTSLEGSPKEVGESFDCSYNQLTSLEWSPEKVGGYFNCYDNYLTSLEGAPEKVGGYFSCSNTRLTSLKGAPKEVGGDFYCNNNKLTSLKGAPKEVRGDFYCYDNRLKSLDRIGEVKGEIYS